jgi:hypothetical protein
LKGMVFLSILLLLLNIFTIIHDSTLYGMSNALFFLLMPRYKSCHFMIFVLWI